MKMTLMTSRGGEGVRGLERTGDLKGQGGGSGLC